MAEGSHSFTCHPHVHPHVEWAMHAFTLQPQSVTALLAGIHFPFCLEQEAELAWVAGYIPRWFACPKIVTYPSTNWARCRVTSMMSPKPLPLRQTAMHNRPQAQHL